MARDSGIIGKLGTLTIPSTGVYLGAEDIGTNQNFTGSNGIETVLQRNMAVKRFHYNWGASYPNALEKGWAAEAPNGPGSKLVIMTGQTGGPSFPVKNSGFGGSTAGWTSGGTTYFGMDQITHGRYDSLLTANFTGLQALGVPILYNLFYEFNGAHNPYYPAAQGTMSTTFGTRGTGETLFINTWQYIYNLAKAAGATQDVGGNVLFCWTTQDNDNTHYAENAYPGDAYVNIIMHDLYRRTLSDATRNGAHNQHYDFAQGTVGGSGALGRGSFVKAFGIAENGWQDGTSSSSSGFPYLMPDDGTGGDGLKYDKDGQLTGADDPSGNTIWEKSLDDLQNRYQNCVIWLFWNQIGGTFGWGQADDRVNTVLGSPGTTSTNPTVSKSLAHARSFAADPYMGVFQGTSVPTGAKLPSTNDGKVHLAQSLHSGSDITLTSVTAPIVGRAVDFLIGFASHYGGQEALLRSVNTDIRLGIYERGPTEIIAKAPAFPEYMYAHYATPISSANRVIGGNGSDYVMNGLITGSAFQGATNYMDWKVLNETGPALGATYDMWYWDVMSEFDFSGGGLTTAGPVDPGTGSPYTFATWRDTFLAVMMDRMSIAKPNAASEMNNLEDGDSYYGAGGITLAYTQHATVNQAEQWLTKESDPPTTRPSDSSWRNSVQMVIDLNRASPMSRVHARQGGNGGTAAQNDALRLYAAATAFIADRGGLWLDPRLDLSVDLEVQKPIWAITLGRPISGSAATQSPSTVTNLTGATAITVSGGVTNCYGRLFTDSSGASTGAALINNGGSPVTFTLDHSDYINALTGASLGGSTVSVGAGSGLLVTRGTVVSGAAINDLFTRNVSSGWGTATSGQTWSPSASTNVAQFSVVNGTGGKTTSVADTSGTIQPMMTASVSQLDYGVLRQWRFSSLPVSGPQHTGVLLRFQDESNLVRSMVQQQPNGTTTLTIEERVATVNAVLASMTIPTLSANTDYLMRCEVQGSTVRTKVWQSGTTEPTNWMLSGTTSATFAGSPGVRFHVLSSNTNLPLWTDKHFQGYTIGGGGLGTPSLTSPPSGTVTVTSETLSWTDSPTPDHYRYRLITDSVAGPWITTSSTSVTISCPVGHTYEFDVQAGDINGQYSPSAVATWTVANPIAGLLLAYGMESYTTPFIIDDSGNKVAATIANAASPPATDPSTSGHSKALKFNSKKQIRIETPNVNHHLDVASGFTIGTWLNLDITNPPDPGSTANGANTRYEIMEKSGSFWFNIRTDTSPLYRLRVGGYFGSGSLPAGYTITDTFTGATSIVPGTWTYVTATYDGAHLKTYINGTLDQSVAQTGSVAIGSIITGVDENLVVGAKHRLGGSAAILQAHFNGDMDDFVLYNSGLTAGQVATLSALAYGSVAPIFINSAVNNLGVAVVNNATTPTTDAGNSVTTITFSLSVPSGYTYIYSDGTNTTTGLTAGVFTATYPVNAVPYTVSFTPVNGLGTQGQPTTFVFTVVPGSTGGGGGSGTYTATVAVPGTPGSTVPATLMVRATDLNASPLTTIQSEVIEVSIPTTTLAVSIINPIDGSVTSSTDVPVVAQVFESGTATIVSVNATPDGGTTLIPLTLTDAVNNIWSGDVIIPSDAETEVDVIATDSAGNIATDGAVVTETEGGPVVGTPFSIGSVLAPATPTIFRVLISDHAGNAVGEVTPLNLDLILPLRVSDPGTITFDIDLFDPMAKIDRLNPDIHDWALQRNGITLAAGILLPNGVKIDTDRWLLNVSGQTWEGYFQFQFMDFVNQNGIVVPDQVSYLDEDIFDIVRSIVNRVLDNNNSIPFSFGTVGKAGVEHSISYSAADQIDLYTIVNDLAALITGFDWEITPDGRMFMYTPQRGKFSTLNLVQNRNILNVQWNNGGLKANRILGSGSGLGNSRILTRRENVASQITDRLYTLPVQFSNLTSFAHVDSVTQTELSLSLQDQESFTVTMRPAPGEDVWGAVDVGDWVQVNYDLLYKKLFGYYRCTQIELQPTAQNDERILFTFSPNVVNTGG